MSGLNVVALISGGKDSLFSLLHCQANGHRVVALANLHPPECERDGTADDLESYMYQTIGHAIIPLYEQALGLPLHRQAIRGGPINQDKSYAPVEESSEHVTDETESLLSLLRRVIRAHPEVNAVSSGAILSDYQRTRVESVAIRLGLTPLSYLWQWPILSSHTPTSLLEDMAAVGQNARIIKVASGGLDDSFLWQNVSDRRTIARLSKAAQRFGSPGDGAVLGEGGEYETLAVNGPPPLWRGRIVIPEDGMDIVPGDAGSASVRLRGAFVRFHDGFAKDVAELRTPPILETRFEQILDKVQSRTERPTRTHCDIEESHDHSDLRSGQITLLSNLVGGGNTAGEQARDIMEQMLARLASTQQRAEHIAYTIIVLRDMADFALVNSVYGSYFTKPNPPARLTIACASVLPSAAFLTISAVCVSGPREGLHVQSRSYWAPANIGPYSQAIKLPDDASLESMRGSVFIAGQIPLVPATMTLAGGSLGSQRFALQATLALQHLARVGQSMKVIHWTFGIAFIAASGDDDLSLKNKADVVRQTWEHYHQDMSGQAPEVDDDEDGEDFDVWHLAHRAGSAPWRMQQPARDPLPAVQTVVPPLVVIHADALPRAAEVEWLGHGRSVCQNPSEERSAVPLHLRDLLHQFRNNTM